MVTPKIETGVIYCADNLDVMITLPSESIDMVYVDPPFFSNRIYETIWGDKEDTAAFNDRWKGGIYHFVEWMRPRLEQIHRLLNPTGTFFCHLDWHAVHYVKIALDEIFGYRNFRNEIVWQRTKGAKGESKGSIAMSVSTDSILFYSKSSKYFYETQYVPYSQEYINKNFKYVDENGDRYSSENLRNPGYRSNLVYDYKGYKPHPNGWLYSKSKMRDLDKKGLLIFPSKKDGRIREKKLLKNMPGIKLTNLWTDIPPISSQSSERVGYPTQKPLALLERILQCTTKKGDIIADFFCGCGTTLVAASNLGRKYIGVDNSPKASQIIRKRLKSLKIDHKEISLNNNI